MKIIHRYITSDFVISLLMTVGIFTFVMCSAAIVKAIDLMTRGLSGLGDSPGVHVQHAVHPFLLDSHERDDDDAAALQPVVV